MTGHLPDDRKSLALVRRYVTRGPGWRRYLWFVRPLAPDPHPRYLSLLGGLQPQGIPDRTGFARSLARDAHRISDADLGRLLDFEWRARLTASYLIGLDRRAQFRDRLGSLLLESHLVYAGQGYCFALSRFAEPEDAAILVAYLDRYLPRTDCSYNQNSAMGALMHLDQKLGTDHAQRFLVPGGLWHQSAFANENPVHQQGIIEALGTIADQLMDDNH
jgi:hypothetical protein